MAFKNVKLKEKINGHDLDLSLCELSSVPVKEIAPLKGITHIDLSCNLLTTVPSDFFKLDHFVKLDLSKNNITELPANIGNLVKLQQLDLYSNQLKNLPSSVSQLKNLKWLDLKDNPLDEKLLKVAGECLDENQCKQCARKVVAYLKEQASEEERKRQQLLKIERERAAEKQRETEQLKKKDRERKKQEKKLRRQEYESNKTLEKSKAVPHSGSYDKGNLDQVSGIKEDVKKDSFNYLFISLTIFIGIVAAVIGGCAFCDSIRPYSISTLFRRSLHQ